MQEQKILQREGRGIRRSQSAPHMHVLVCICSNRGGGGGMVGGTFV